MSLRIDLIFCIHSLEMAGLASATGCLASLKTYLNGRSCDQLVGDLRDIGLLCKSVKCPDCHLPNDLIAPLSDNEQDRTRRTKCRTLECRIKHDYKAHLFFKWQSIFEWFTQMEMTAIVLVIFCYCLQMMPSTTELVVSAYISRKTVGAIYKRVRLAVQAYNNKHHRKRLGGPASEDDVHGVRLEGETESRRVVEYDESELCVCVCACVCVCVHMSHVSLN